MLSSNASTPSTATQIRLVYFQRAFKRRELLPLTSECLWKIEQGIVRTFTWNEEGKTTTLGFWGKGDIVGRALSKLEFYQIECLTPVRISQMPPDFPALHEALLIQLWTSEQMLSIINQHRIVNRLWCLLEWLACRFGEAVPGGISLNLYLTHQDIAETINTTRVRITELLSQLEREGKIKRSRRNLVLTTKPN